MNSYQTVILNSRHLKRAGLLVALVLTACGGGSSTYTPPEWPISPTVYTTAEQQIQPVAIPLNTPTLNPKEVPLYAKYGYSAWQTAAGLPVIKRTELAPGYNPGAIPAARLLSFFTITDIHITDKESPAQANLFGWNALYGIGSAGLSSAWSPVIVSTTQMLDAAVQTVNALHKKTPFDFGISLGDTINNNQYNELRWYIDVLDGKVIYPASGDQAGAGYIDYQMPFKAVGLDKSIPWYQTIGNHDQFFVGSFLEDNKTMQAHIGSAIINIANNPTIVASNIAGTGAYMGVVDGTTTYGDVIGAGLQQDFAVPPTVIADFNRHALSTSTSTSLNWMKEFFKTSSNPVGHGFSASNINSDFTSYSFIPKTNIPIKVIVLDDTCGGPLEISYALGCLDQTRLNWLTAELQAGQNNNQLMIIAAHVPINPYNSFTDPTQGNFSFFRTPGFTDTSLTAFLHNYPNLLLWISGHRHVNTVTPQPYDPAQITQGPENSFWEVETASLRDFPQQFRTFEIRRNTDNTISILITNVDPAVAPGTPAATSRGYAIGAARIFGADDVVRQDTRSHAYNAELVKTITPAMQALIANYGVLLP